MENQLEGKQEAHRKNDLKYQLPDEDDETIGDDGNNCDKNITVIIVIILIIMLILITIRSFTQQVPLKCKPIKKFVSTQLLLNIYNYILNWW